MKGKKEQRRTQKSTTASNQFTLWESQDVFYACEETKLDILSFWVFKQVSSSVAQADSSLSPSIWNLSSCRQRQSNRFPFIHGSTFVRLLHSLLSHYYDFSPEFSSIFSELHYQFKKIKKPGLCYGDTTRKKMIVPSSTSVRWSGVGEWDLTFFSLEPNMGLQKEPNKKYRSYRFWASNLTLLWVF